MGAIKGEGWKRRDIEYLYGNNIIEVDVYHGDLEGLVLAEVEFVNEDESNKFIPPGWLVQEITYDENYKDRNLAMYGVPERRQRI